MAQLEAVASRYVPPGRKQHRAEAGQRTGGAGDDLAVRIPAYLATIPGAKSGCRGHDRTFYVANRLVRGYALTVDVAMPHFLRWNEKCEPQWSEHDLRRKLDQADKQPGPRGFLLDKPMPGRSAGSSGSGPVVFRNYVWDEVKDGDTMRKVRRGRRGPELLEELQHFTGGWPRRVGSSLFAADVRGNLRWFKTASELFAWIESHYSTDGGRGVDWVGGSDCVTQQVFFDLCGQECEDFDAVELCPHEPLLPRTYYHHPEPAGGDGTALADLLRQFAPATGIDGELIRAYFLSLLWGGRPGQRPAWLFTVGDEDEKGGRGVGKTTLAVVGAELVGGFLSYRVGEKFDVFMQRVLSPGATGRRVILLDNLKRDRFADQDVEALITSPTLSGKELYKGEGRRPNHFTFVVTANTPGAGEDIAQRAVMVKLERPIYDPGWLDGITAFVEKHRWAIIGDCLAELRSAGTPFLKTSRWGDWQRAVLSKLPEPDAVLDVIRSRQHECNEDAEQRQWVEEAVSRWLKLKGYDPVVGRFLIEIKVLAHIIGEAAGEPMTPNKAGAFLKHQHPPCLTKSHRNGRRFWLWTGKQASADAPPGEITGIPTDKDGKSGQVAD